MPRPCFYLNRVHMSSGVTDSRPITIQTRSQSVEKAASFGASEQLQVSFADEGSRRGRRIVASDRRIAEHALRMDRGSRQGSWRFRVDRHDGDRRAELGGHDRSAAGRATGAVGAALQPAKAAPVSRMWSTEIRARGVSRCLSHDRSSHDAASTEGPSHFAPGTVARENESGPSTSSVERIGLRPGPSHRTNASSRSRAPMTRKTSHIARRSVDRCFRGHRARSTPASRFAMESVFFNSTVGVTRRFRSFAAPLGNARVSRSQFGQMHRPFLPSRSRHPESPRKRPRCCKHLPELACGRRQVSARFRPTPF
jgi:hypothetical protein